MLSIRKTLFFQQCHAKFTQIFVVVSRLIKIPLAGNPCLDNGCIVLINICVHWCCIVNRILSVIFCHQDIGNFAKFIGKIPRKCIIVVVCIAISNYQ